MLCVSVFKFLPMNWKTALLWLLVFIASSYFFFSFASYLFDKQESIQLFTPQWGYVASLLSVPGGGVKVAGMWLTQYYCYPLPAAILNGLLVIGTGIGCWLLLQRIGAGGYNFFLALFLVLGLMKAHIQYNYVADGSVGLLVMVWMLLAVTSVREWKARLAASIAGVAVVFWTSGQMVVLFVVLLLAYGYIARWEKPLLSLIPLVLGCLLAYCAVRLAIRLPLTDGLKGSSYHDAQMQSDSFIYHVWILSGGLLLLLMGASRLLKQLKWEKRKVKWIVTCGTALCLSLFAFYCRPAKYDMQNQMMDQLAYLSKRQKWDVIISLHTGRQIPNSISRCYLNMALAQKGLLGNRLFYFYQNGPQGLLPSFNGTWQMNVLLSDIHFLVGDVSISESYAMEALMAARRGGSPRMLERLVEISLIRGERELAAKYMSLLGQMPVYKGWKPSDAGMKGKYILPEENGDLLSLYDLDVLWKKHLAEGGAGRVAYEYTGCLYLLGKKIDLFRNFLLQTAQLPVAKPLPLHFQEAALVAFAGDKAALDTLQVDAPVRQRYADFIRQSSQQKNQPDGVSNIYRSFGNTFWFYYYSKEPGK